MTQLTMLITQHQLITGCTTDQTDRNLLSVKSSVFTQDPLNMTQFGIVSKKTDTTSQMLLIFTKFSGKVDSNINTTRVLTFSLSVSLKITLNQDTLPLLSKHISMLTLHTFSGCGTLLNSISSLATRGSWNRGFTYSHISNICLTSKHSFANAEETSMFKCFSPYIKFMLKSRIMTHQISILRVRYPIHRSPIINYGCARTTTTWVHTLS